MKILVTDGSQRSALAVVRALGASGHQLHVGECKDQCLAATSRFCFKSFEYPDPYTNEAEFKEVLFDYMQENGIDLTIPVSDITSNIIAENRCEFSNISIICMPSSESYIYASDKNSLMHLAEKIDIPIPKTIFYSNSQEYYSSELQQKYPCVIKPSRSRLRIGKRWYGTQVKIVYSEQELLEILKGHEYSYPFMIQERIYGEGQALFALCREGELITYFSHRRIREKPPWGGVSVFRESIETDADLKDYSKKLLKQLRWNGVAMVEFKRCEKTNVPYLMEINGRFWGSLQLAIDAGINFPGLLVDQCLGREIKSQSYCSGVKSRWLSGDLDNLIMSIKYKSRLENISIFKLLYGFLKYNKKTKFEVERLTDIKPGIFEWSNYIKSIISR